MIEIESKICSICNIEKSLTEFYSQKKHSEKRGEWIYYNPECKECTKSRSMKWQKDNPEQHYIIARRRETKPDRKEKTRAFAKKQRESGYTKGWQQNNPEWISNYQVNVRSKKKHKITPKEKRNCKEYFEFKCAYCGLSEDEHKEIYGQQLHMDHVDPNGANDLSNNIPACMSCNCQKWEFLMEEWYEKQEFYNKDKLNKIYKWLNEDYKFYIKPRKSTVE